MVRTRRGGGKSAGPPLFVAAACSSDDEAREESGSAEFAPYDWKGELEGLKERVRILEETLLTEEMRRAAERKEEQKRWESVQQQLAELRAAVTAGAKPKAEETAVMDAEKLVNDVKQLRDDRDADCGRLAAVELQLAELCQTRPEQLQAVKEDFATVVRRAARRVMHQQREESVGKYQNKTEFEKEAEAAMVWGVRDAVGRTGREVLSELLDLAYPKAQPKGKRLIEQMRVTPPSVRPVCSARDKEAVDLYVQFSDELTKRDFVALLWKPLAEVLAERKGEGEEGSGGVAHHIPRQFRSLLGKMIGKKREWSTEGRKTWVDVVQGRPVLLERKKERSQPVEWVWEEGKSSFVCRLC